MKPSGDAWTSPEMTKVLCVGIATLDYIFAVEGVPRRGEKYRAHELVVAGGGTAATAAHAIARLGGKAVLATRLGDDPTGDAIVAELEAAGVDCSLAHRYLGVRSPSSAVLIDPEGERLVTCYADVRTPDDASFLPTRFPRARAPSSPMSPGSRARGGCFRPRAKPRCRA